MLNGEIWRHISALDKQSAQKSKAYKQKSPVKIGHGVNLSVVQKYAKLDVLSPNYACREKSTKPRAFAK